MGVIPPILACCVTAHAQSSSNPEFIQARVTVVNINFVLAVDIPANSGTNTLWDIGTVPGGGVADTWYDDDVHGSFRLQNSGDLSAHIYIVAERHDGFDPWGGLPTIDPTPLAPSTDEKFAIAFATNVEDLLPDWNILDLLIESAPNRTAARMGFIPPGDYILFDLRYYAPNPCCVPLNPVQFRLAFYALDLDEPANIPSANPP
jgi:hypothetical protein